MQSQDENSNTTKTNTTEKVLGTLNKLSEALLASKVDGEEPTVINSEVFSMGVSVESAELIGKEPFKFGNCEVKIPEDSIKLGNETVDQVVC